MTTAQKQRVTDLLLDSIAEKNQAAEWWRRNASARHGIPFVEPPPKINLTVTGSEEKPIDQPKQEEPVADKPASVETAKQPVDLGCKYKPPESSWKTFLAWLAPWLLGAGLAFATLGLTWWMLNKDKPDGSLYQYLEDNGYHVPIEGEPVVE